jgi:hypothetical protein
VRGQEHKDTLTSINNMCALLLKQSKHQEVIDLLAPSEPAARKAFTEGQREASLRVPNHPWPRPRWPWL